MVRCASPGGLHRIAYREWGDPREERVLVCAHGLTRCARDFDALAASLSDRYRVICPDVAGRGDSDWLADPMLYQLPQYLGDMVTLVARLDVEQVHWVGTSMGGLIGMALAAQAGTPVTRLVTVAVPLDFPAGPDDPELHPGARRRHRATRLCGQAGRPRRQAVR